MPLLPFATMRTGRLAPLLLSAIVASCSSSDDPTTTPTPTPKSDLEIRVDTLVASMTLEEKVDQMHGGHLYAVNGLWETPDNDRLALPGFKMVDGPRGVRAGKATTFPVGMARGATWDPELERRVGAAMGKETAAKGGNVLLAPTINTLRHPKWGRAQETYGEDTHHLGRMGTGFVLGAQEHVVASVKHLAANSIEETRYTVDVRMDERTLREVYLPHFERVVRDAHPGSVMSAYNVLNGQYCSENAHLLGDILKRDWAFDGFVESDWVFGTRSTVPAVTAGLDIEMPVDVHFGPKLVEAVQTGAVAERVIDDAVRRIVRKKLEHLRDHPMPPTPDVVESPAHIALCQEVAEKSFVLLRNQATALPLSGVTSLAVIGGLADTVNLGDKGSSNAVPSSATTPFAGLRTRAGAVPVTLFGDALSADDQKAIAAAGAAVVVVGLTAQDEGERIDDASGGDRKTLSLSPAHEALIHQVAALNPRTIVVLEGGSAIIVRPWIDEVAAVVMAWYPGQQGGTALARVLFGDVSPSGKLPITFPRDEAQLPPFDSVSKQVDYGFFHGYRHIEREGATPEFPFGFGLSYTTFGYSALRVDAAEVAAGAPTTAHVDVTNEGTVAGDEVVQLFVSATGSRVERAPRDLRAFARVHLEPGETKTVDLPLLTRDFAFWDVTTNAFVVEPLTYALEVPTPKAKLTASLRVK